MEKIPTYTLAKGRIKIKPSMKYELVISLRVFKPGQNRARRLFSTWADAMEKRLSPRTYKEVLALIGHMHEWELSHFLQEYTDEDRIEGIAAYVESDSEGQIKEWVQNRSEVLGALNLQPDQFAAWYADFLTRYYREGFGELWESTYKKEVLDSAKRLKEELDAVPFDIMEFMEGMTQRQFTGERKIVLYPSTFSRPDSGYLFAEDGKKVVVCKSDSDVKELAGTLFHELLHSLLSGWMTSSEEIKKLIQSQLASEVFKNEWEEAGRGEYDYPNNWFDELAVHSFGEYLTCKAGFRSKAEALGRCYTGYMEALCCAAFSKYEEFGRIDDFLYYAIGHIREVEKPRIDSGFEGYLNAGGQLEITDVDKGSDAYRSGLRVNDIVLEANGVPLTGESDAKIGDEINKVIRLGQPCKMKLTVSRDHKTMEVDATFAPKRCITFEFRE
jgi:hypothetical protein